MFRVFGRSQALTAESKAVVTNEGVTDNKRMLCACSRMLTYADAVYADVCGRMLTYADACCMADAKEPACCTCGRMRTYADIC